MPTRRLDKIRRALKNGGRLSGDGPFSPTGELERVLGYDPEALVGTPLRDLIHPEDLAGADAALRATISEGSAATSDLRVRHKDGTR